MYLTKTLSLLPSLRSGLAAARHPFGDGLREAKAAVLSQPIKHTGTYNNTNDNQWPLASCLLHLLVESAVQGFYRVNPKRIIASGIEARRR